MIVYYIIDNLFSWFTMTIEGGSTMFSKNLIEQIYSAIANSVKTYDDFKDEVYVNTYDISDVRKSSFGILDSVSIFFNSNKLKEYNMANIELALIKKFCKN